MYVDAHLYLSLAALSAVPARCQDHNGVLAVQLNAEAARNPRADGRGRRQSSMSAKASSKPAAVQVVIPVGGLPCTVVFTYIADRELVLAKSSGRDVPRALLDALSAREASGRWVHAITARELQEYGRPYRCGFAGRTASVVRSDVTLYCCLRCADRVAMTVSCDDLSLSGRPCKTGLEATAPRPHAQVVPADCGHADARQR
jgi:hypothetical protein